jgi:hypothetical protein
MDGPNGEKGINIELIDISLILPRKVAQTKLTDNKIDSKQFQGQNGNSKRRLR